VYPDLFELLFHPDTFFERKSREPANLLLPAIIVSIGSILNFFFSRIASQTLDNDYLVNFLWNIHLLPDSSILILVLPFFAWFCFSGILFITSRLLAGTGSFAVTFRNTGYGCLPLTFLSVTNILNGFFGYPPSYPSVIGHWFFVMAFLFWAGWIWSAAMEKTHSISHSRAKIPSIAAILLYLSYNLFNFLAFYFLVNLM